MKIIEKHSSQFEIAVPKKLGYTEEAAAVLQKYIFEATDCKLDITDKICEKCKEHKLVVDVEPFELTLENSDGLGDEGFIIAEKDGTVYLYATGRDGLFYAVYEFLEKYFGCLWLTSTDDYIPHRCCAEIPDGTFDKQLPALNYRELYYRDSWDKTFSDKQKLNGQLSFVKGKRVAEGHKNWGFWCHSFYTLVPPKDYYETHPEYFALVDDKRVNDGQLCCTNDEMIDVAIKNLKKFMDDKPEAKYWSVSQNDTTRFCTCEKCRKLDEEAGSQIGSILYFVNRVAEAFPDKVISTLSYWYSRTAPKKVELRDNVHIMLCNIECDRSKPIPENPQCESFVKDIGIWKQYCGNVFLWDYDIQFSNLISPFPNLHVLAPNMRFFHEQNVRSIFNQGNRDARGDFWALRSYLLAKLSWNPYCDVEKHRSDFINAYYGAAAPYIDGYIETMTNALKATGEGLSIFGQPQDEKFLSSRMIPVYEAILAKALDSVKDDEVLHLRVEEVRLGLVYARLKAKLYKDDDEKSALCAFFRKTADAIGLEKVEEWHLTVDKFLEDVAAQ